MTSINVNGKAVRVKADPTTPLLWVIRDHLNMTGTKFGCGMAQCGACTVYLNDRPVRSCSVPLSAVGTQKVTTIEGVKGKVVEAVQQAWVEENAPQCGYCQSGQVMAAVDLLSRTPKPSENQIDDAMAGNLCRCASYVRIKRAIVKASQTLEA